jgi:uncharacterized protein
MRSAGTERRSASPATAAEAQGVASEGPPATHGGIARRFFDPQLIAIGISGGILSGLLGVGGGIIMVPLLVLWAGYSQRDAHAISLGAIIPISLAGVVTYGVAGEVRVWDAVALALGAVAGARVGATLLATLDEYVLKLAFGVFLVCVAVLMGLRG